MTIESVRPISAAMHEDASTAPGPIQLEAVKAAPATTKTGMLVVGAFADGTLPAVGATSS